MAIAHVQTPAGGVANASATSVALAFGSNVTAGSMIVGDWRYGANGRTVTLSDTQSNTYTSDAVSVQDTGDAANPINGLGYALNCAGGATTVTFGISGAAANLRFSIAEYSGVAASSALDKTTTATGSGTGTGQTASTGSVTPDSDGQLFHSSIHARDGVTYSAGTDFTLNTTVPTTGASQRLGSERFIQTTAAAHIASINYDVGAGSTTWGMVLATFRAAAAVVPSPPLPSVPPGRIAPGGRWQSWAGSWGEEAAGGGTTFPLAVGGTLTPGGGLVRDVSITRAGAITPTGAPAKLVTKPFAGGLTPAGVLAKTAQKAFAGGLTPSGALTMIKVVLRAFAGSITPTGALTKVVGKPLAGTVSSSGALAKLIAKSFAGSLTPTGALVKAVSKALAGGLTPSGALTLIRVLLRTFTGTITPTGALARQVQKGLGGTLTPAGSLRRLVAKSLLASIAPAGSLRKAITRTFTGLIAAVGTLIASSGPTVPVVTPPDRRWRIPAEDRTWRIVAEDRRWRVTPVDQSWRTGAEDRTWRVTPEDRTWEQP